MNTDERVMRVMTHVNIGATLAMVAWLVWSGHQVVAGDWKIPRAEPPASRAPGSTTRALEPPSCCLAPLPAARPVLRVDGATTLAVGGGFAPPPFPPDERVAMRAPARHVEPPWRSDTRGELHMRDR